MATCGPPPAARADLGADHSARSDGPPGCTVEEMTKVRLDATLAERGLFPSRSAAATAVRAGEIRLGIDGRVALKPGQMIEPEADLVVAEKQRFVSRGGIKLENALEKLGIDLDGVDCLDVGASTGGFTDCMLQRGASRVISLDVAYGQIDSGIRADPRVTVIERRNARDLTPEMLPFQPAFATVDVSFISLAKILPAVSECITPGGRILAMVKPQFELGRNRVARGVVRKAGDRREAINNAAASAEEIGLRILGIAYSGLPGPKGNRETFLLCGREGTAIADLESAVLEVEP